MYGDKRVTARRRVPTTPIKILNQIESYTDCCIRPGAGYYLLFLSLIRDRVSQSLLIDGDDSNHTTKTEIQPRPKIVTVAWTMNGAE
jgi:hypothetical protein